MTVRKTVTVQLRVWVECDVEVSRHVHPDPDEPEVEYEIHSIGLHAQGNVLQSINKTSDTLSADELQDVDAAADKLEWGS